MEPFVWWLIAALLLLTVEIMTSAIWGLCFAIGCLGGMTVAFFTDSLTSQVIAMAVVTLIACVVLLPRLKKILRHENAPHPAKATNADAMIGRTATVIKTIAPGTPGRVKLDGDNWQAVSANPEATFEPGAVVTVRAVNSIILTVD